MRLSSALLITLGASLLVTGCSIPDHPQGSDDAPLTHLGNVMRNRGDDVAAADFYARSLQRNPNDITARTALAGLFEAHGDTTNAIAEYRAGLAFAPDNTDLLRGLGRCLLKQGQAAEAKEQFERALKEDGDDIKSMNGLGVALDYLGNHQAAQDVYKDALDQQEDDTATLNNLAHSYVLTGNYEGARELLEPHVKSPKANAVMRYNLAEAYSRLEMDADAERVLKIDMPASQVGATLAEFVNKRKSMAVQSKNYATMGTYATAALAASKAEIMDNKLSIKSQGLILQQKTSVNGIGGTPQFQVVVLGFVNLSKLKSFCDNAQRQGFPCQAVSQ